jgi:hypothetical protein
VTTGVRISNSGRNAFSVRWTGDTDGFESPRRDDDAGSLRPARSLYVDELEPLPVCTYGSEDVDDDGTFRAGADFVRSVRRDPPGSAGTEIANLAPDAKGDRSLEDHAELFVLVAVLRDEAPWIELDHCKADAIPVHGTSENAFPDS